ncbi:MAG: DUF2156 domain-containing protein, partial [Oscillospiraceae bacterium]|nr:DUF2156 domain-containing protein [Oscillospiraceae bacterium]
MLEFRDIKAEDKLIFDRYRQPGSIASEAVFATMFIWNDYYNLKVAEDSEFFYFQFNVKNRIPSYYFPIGSGDCNAALDVLKEYTRANGHVMAFRLVTEEQLEKLRAYSGAEFLANEERDCEDYIYPSAQLISLAGKKLHAKRNHINYFLENYEYTYETVTPEVAKNECAPLMYELIEHKDHNVNSFELPAMKRFFDNYEILGERGAVIRVGGEIVAMSFGEPLSDQAALIQLEVAREEYRGAYQMINKLFCENEWRD